VCQWIVFAQGMKADAAPLQEVSILWGFSRLIDEAIFVRRPNHDCTAAKQKSAPLISSAIPRATM
jgi:hypothetical protein